MALEGLQVEEITGGVSAASAFWGSKDKEAQQILAAVKKARDAHAQALTKNSNAKPTQKISFVVSTGEAAKWKLRINSQLRNYLKETNAETGIRGFQIDPMPGDKRRISFTPAVLRRYEKNGDK